MLIWSLKPRRVCFGQFSFFPDGCPLQWFDRTRLIEVDHCIELFGEPGTKIVLMPPGATNSSVPVPVADS